MYSPARPAPLFQVLVDFESRLPSADFVAIDTELTGVDLEDDRWVEGSMECRYSVYGLIS